MVLGELQVIQKQKWKSMPLALVSYDWSLPAAIGAGLLALTLVLTNGWMSDDGYVTFRSVEQFFAGNGPRWNPHERVQAFTHPLWFGLLCLIRFLSSDACLNALLLSLVCGVGAAFVLAKISTCRSNWTIAVLVLASSKAVIDFSTSGLENPLSHFVCLAFLLSLLNFATATPAQRQAQLVKLSWCLALATTLRLDLITLLGVPYLWAFGSLVWMQRGISWRLIGKIVGASSLPIMWTLFSTIYYGFPLPNTAYAKLGAGVPTKDLLPHGFAYLMNSLRLDGITLFAVALSLVASFWSRRGVRIAMALGILCNLVYVVRVGGDFMSGRFLTVSMFLSVGLLASMRWSKSALLGVAAALLIYNSIQPYAPWRTDATYVNKVIDDSGVADERGYYFQHSSLWLYLDSLKDRKPFPEIIWVKDAIEFGKSNYIATVMAAIGIFGYYVRLDQIVIDPMALSDPLLARTPVRGRWRVGHMLRDLPVGYAESIATGTNQIVDPDLHKLYDQLILVTRGPLFTLERWRAIAELNLGLK